MSDYAKPLWWDEIASHFGFTNDTSSSLSDETIFQSLQSNLIGRIDKLAETSFQSLFNQVTQASSSTQRKSNILISNASDSDLLLGYGGTDYLSGTRHDDILFGGTDNDYLRAGSGNDLIIGDKDKNGGQRDRDTVSYHQVQTSVVMSRTIKKDEPPVDPDVPVVPSKVYDFSWADLTDTFTPKLKNFIVGEGGHAIDVTKLLEQVGYTGNDPVADGYLRITDIPIGLKIQFDMNGASKGGLTDLVRIYNVNLAQFSLTHNLITKKPLPPVVVEPQEDVEEASDFSIVDNDGFGNYDILYSIENILGSRFDDTLVGRNDENNLLSGNSGNDMLYGEGGNDTIIGGRGQDTIFGGDGDDLILVSAGNDSITLGDGMDTIKFDGGYWASLGTYSITILDFVTGDQGDKINVSELLAKSGYQGGNPVTDGMVQIVQSGADSLIQCDKDGNAGSSAKQTIAILKNKSATSFSVDDNLEWDAPTILFTPVLGQSNASGLTYIGENGKSGVSEITDTLKDLTDYDQVISLFKDEHGNSIVPAIGGSAVLGNSYTNPMRVWWNHETNQPGDALFRAVDIMVTQVAELRAQGSVKPIIIWGQGETDVSIIGASKVASTQMFWQQKYMDATRAVFDYIKEHVGDDVEFYIMQTGRYHVENALEIGQAQLSIDKTLRGLDLIREGQEKLALHYDDVHIAVNYTDLPLMGDVTIAEDPNWESDWAVDVWHTSVVAREIIGQRIAGFIALELGQSHVMDNPGAYPLNALSDLTLITHVGKEIEGNDLDNLIAGTTGDDFIMGWEGNDIIVSGKGSDVLEGNEGADTFIYNQDSLGYLDTINDFDVSEGDKIFIGEILFGYDPLSDAIQDFVSLSENAGDTIISIDRDGTSSVYSAQESLALKNVTGLTAEDILTNGNLLVA